MGFLFYNNWPYSDTYFPSMDDHIDPINHEYFAGLMTELERLEYYLGQNPQGSYENLTARLLGIETDILNNDTYVRDTLGEDVERGFADVRDKLENHDHSGGYFGRSLLSYEIVNWEFSALLSNFQLFPGSGTVGPSFTGFNYYDYMYFGPTQVASGYRPIQAYNVSTLVHGLQYLTETVGFPGNPTVYNDIAFFPLRGWSHRILKFGILDWSINFLTPGGGVTDPGCSCEGGNYIWFGSRQSPGMLVRKNKADDTMSTYTLSSGNNDIRWMISDDTYVYLALNTSPIRLVKWRIADNVEQWLELTGFVGVPVFMGLTEGFLWIFSDDGTTDFIRFDLVNATFRIYNGNWVKQVRGGYDYGDYWLLSLQQGGNLQTIAVNKSTLVTYMSIVYGSSDDGTLCLPNFPKYMTTGSTVSHFDRVADISVLP